jgi:Flp pilus assembly protein TadG
MTSDRHPGDVSMNVTAGAGRPRRAATGQILVVAALAMVAIVSLVALVLEGGNAYAHQRQTQNAADAAADAGAAVIARRFANASLTDGNVNTAIQSSIGVNLAAGSTATAYYTNVKGQFMNSAGVAPVAKVNAAVVGNGVFPPGAQGVAVNASQPFGAFIGRAIGFTSFTSSAEATAVAGALVGGVFLPVVFPVNISSCEGSGALGSQEINGGWTLSQPPTSPGGTPDGQEYIVPLCKTGSGSFQILDFDPSLKCEEEIALGLETTLNIPGYVNSDNGNDCAKKILDAMNSKHGTIVNVPICDNGPDADQPIGNCDTKGGSNAEYHIVKVASFWLDYMSDKNKLNDPNSPCQSLPNGSRIFLPGTDIEGNGSSSCIVGWFIRYVSAGTVGTDGPPDANNDTIGIQLIK